ncbi:hypothetical protein LshimejAT787_2300230 [Lyophyllum shimeji]|uniref:AMP-binding enzyme C-terminal domain-containing protein n=1 Tax=Lyophyllum shimeji TaxID=47721 RepID=A0A9P3Q0M5_LYOSH|nr:hypothetical protein LshimejAT787_2300230 [Lyophyllum shimeji]
MKAPAKLEGCPRLDHSDISSAYVVGVPNDYSGEVAMAFVVLTADAARRVKEDPTDAAKIKASRIRHVTREALTASPSGGSEAAQEDAILEVVTRGSQ